jgi:hypothetical protein
MFYKNIVQQRGFFPEFTKWKEKESVAKKKKVFLLNLTRLSLTGVAA